MGSAHTWQGGGERAGSRPRHTACAQPAPPPSSRAIALPVDPNDTHVNALFIIVILLFLTLKSNALQ